MTLAEDSAAQARAFVPACRANPIGIFDSGVGGLTVLRALTRVLPHENFVYLGDTARLPYGTKSQETVAAYAIQVAHHLIETHKIKMLVVACNTASALAHDALAQRFPDLPCLGVIDPSASAAAAQSQQGRIVVLATEGTVRSNAYRDAILRHRPSASIHAIPCNLLVGLAEEGWCEGQEAEAIVARYLENLCDLSFDTVILGCTHFPLLAPVFRKLLPPHVAILDSASTTAQAIHEFAIQNNLLNPQKTQGHNNFLVTDSPERFRILATRFLGASPQGTVDLIALKPVSGLNP